MNHDVFISYSSQNRDAAQAICHVLEQNEIRCWIAPRDIPGGSQYGDIIEDAIKTCKVVVVLFSKTAAASPWVSGELNVAFEEQKTIIPLRLDQTPLKGQNRVMLNQRHWIDAYPDYKTKFSDLVSAVSQATGKVSGDTPTQQVPPPVVPPTAPQPAARPLGNGPVELKFGTTTPPPRQPVVPNSLQGAPRGAAMPPRQPVAAPRPAAAPSYQRPMATGGNNVPPRVPYTGNTAMPATTGAAPQVQPKKKGGPNWKVIIPIVGGVVLLLVLILVFSGSGSGSSSANADKESYLAMVERCRSAMAAADNFPDLTEAASTLSDIEDMELEHRADMPDVYNQLASLQSYYEEMQQKQRREYLEIADNFKSRGDYRTAYDHYAAASRALPDDEELKRLVKQILPDMGYVYVNDVVFSNSEEDGTDIDEAGTTLYANRMRYLFPKVIYDSFLPEDESTMRVHVNYKIITPSGTLKSGSSSPSGYTSATSFLIAPGEKDQGEWLSGWGNSSTSTYEAGTYTFELYYHDHKIYEGTFELH